MIILLELTKDINIENINLYDITKLKSSERNLQDGQQGEFEVTGGRESKAKYPNDEVHKIGDFLG